MTVISPSILSADFASLGADIASVESAGAEYLHIDVMDGIFVPNISIGVPVVRSVRRATGLVLDVHLMIDRPIRYVEAFADAGADIIVFHLEADSAENTAAAIEKIRALGKRPGLSIKPGTPAEALFPYLGLIDMALVMTVEPGFGGQSFMYGQLPKIAEIRRFIRENRLSCDLEVDGGVNACTARLCVEAGANVLVAGTAVFGAADRAEAIRELRGQAL